MAARRLTTNEVGDMPEQAAYWGTEHMQDAQVSCGLGHCIGSQSRSG
jgi:hypothetical protein